MPIPDHFQIQFSTNWREKIQQKKSRLDAYLEYDHFDGTRKRHDIIGKVQSQRKGGRKASTPLADVPDEVEWATASEWEVPASTLDEWDETKLAQLVLPTSRYVAAHAAAWSRDRDDNAWRVALSPKSIGPDSAITTSQLPGHTVTLNGFGDITGITGHTVPTAGGLTLAKLIDLAGALNLEDVDEGDAAPRVLVCTSKQIMNLLKEDKVQSADFNTIRALVAGTVDTFMGFKFVRCERLPKFGTTRTCVAWVKGAISVSEKALKVGKMDVRTDLSDTMQIRSTWRLGGIRMEDSLVATMACTE